MKTKKLIIIGIALLLMPLFTFGRQTSNKYVSKYFPLNMTREAASFASPDEIRDKFEINVDALSVKKVKNRKNRYSALMDGTFDAQILTKPLIKPLKTMDVLYSHPSFISVVKFPSSIKIISAKTNMKMSDFSYSENLLTFSINANAKMGNIVLTAYDKTLKINKVFNFIIKKYENSNVRLDNEYGLYATNRGDFLSLTVFYKNIEKIDRIKLLEKYVALNGVSYFKRKFNRNGSYETLLLDGVPVYIVRDDNNGRISFYDINFRIQVGSK